MFNTLCEKCVYLEQSKCGLDKDISEIAGRHFCKGFCRYKKLFIPADGDKDQDKLSIVITGNNEKLIHKTIDPAIKTKGIAEIVLETTNKKMSQDIFKRYDVSWSIEKIVGEEELSNMDKLEFGVFGSKSHWFLFAEEGKKINKDLIYTFQESLKDKNKNFLAIYSDENDGFNIIGNKFAFMQMQGNYKKDWLLKLKDYADWKDVCIQATK